jgi:hypothetical protein
MHDKKSIIITIVLFSAILLFSDLINAREPEHAPLFKTSELTCINLHKCLSMDNNNFSSPPETLTIIWKDNSSKETPVYIIGASKKFHYEYVNEIDISIKKGGTKRFINTCKLDASLIPRTGYAADLNRDGEMDYVLEFDPYGNGLQAEFRTLVFLLSQKKKYVLYKLDAFAPDDEDFVSFMGSKTSQFIHTYFVYGEKGKDGNAHNYFVYNILEFTNDGIKLANHYDSRFPMWIMFTYKPNHKDTDQLSKEQKKILWEKVNPFKEISK